MATPKSPVEFLLCYDCVTDRNAAHRLRFLARRYQYVCPRCGRPLAVEWLHRLISQHRGPTT